MALVGECRGWNMETDMISQWKEHRDLFPQIPSQSRFNRRRRNLMQTFNLIRRIVLSWIDVAQDRQCLIDSLPVQVVQFHLVPSSTNDWAAHGITPYNILSRRAIKNRIGIGELDRALSFHVVENDYRLSPGVAVILRHAGKDITHVLLAVGHCAKGDDQVLFFLSLDDERLPDPP